MLPNTIKTAHLVKYLLTGLILIAQLSQAALLGSWTTNQVSTNYGLRCITYANGRYVAFGEHTDWGTITTSEDGTNWTVRADGLSLGAGAGLSWPISLAYAGNRFFALGGFGYSATSTNGIDWTVFYHYTNGMGPELYSVAASNSTRLVAVGAPVSGTSTNVWTSTNGINWTPRNSTTPAGVILVDIAFGAGMYVAIPGSGFGVPGGTDPGHIYTSPTGVTWTQRNILAGNRVSYCNGLFIIPAGVGTNLVSTNGIDWGIANTGITNQLGKIYFLNGLFMARTGQYLGTSTNGTNWVQYDQVLPGYGVKNQSFATDGYRITTVGGSSFGAYNGFVYQSEVLAGIEIAATAPPIIALSGLVGRSYQLQFTDSLNLYGSNNWQTLVTITLPAKTFNYTDVSATNSQRFYRSKVILSP